MNLHQRASGVLLHITSLPGAHGIGDFGPEAYHFADWLQACGQHLTASPQARPTAASTGHCTYTPIPGRSNAH